METHYTHQPRKQFSANLDFSEDNHNRSRQGDKHNPQEGHKPGLEGHSHHRHIHLHRHLKWL